MSLAETTAHWRGRSPEVPSLKSLIAVVADALDPEVIPTTKRDWTSHIAHTIADFARARGLVPYGTQFAPDHREYLCDQIWAIEDDETWESHAGLVLAMECEWSSSDEQFLLDYCKLPDVAATRRVLIGNLGTRKHWPTREDLLDTACAIAKLHQQFTDRENVAAFLCEQGGIEFVECWTISGKGAMRRVRRSEDC